MDNLYIKELNKFDCNITNKIHDFGRDNNVPIIMDDGLSLLLSIVSIVRPKRILEIGTAIGFSSIMMALNSNATIDTIEKKNDMYTKAIDNINKVGLTDRIRVHLGDGENVSLDELEKEYDIIFIDAAKAQYRKYFERYESLLSKNGVIISDNILFHGYVEKYKFNIESDASKDLKALARKINNYNEWLKSNPNYNTIFLNIGDGIAISTKRSLNE